MLNFDCLDVFSSSNVSLASSIPLLPCYNNYLLLSNSPNESVRRTDLRRVSLSLFASSWIDESIDLLV